MFRKFANDTSGAVTVDWVVLCGATVALAIGVVAALQTGIDSAATGVANSLSTYNGAEIETAKEDNDAAVAQDTEAETLTPSRDRGNRVGRTSARVRL